MSYVALSAGFGALTTSRPAPCQGGAYLLIPGITATCDATKCITFDANGNPTRLENTSCVEACPDGYVAAQRKAPDYQGGSIDVCVTPSVYADIERQRPGEIERIGVSAAAVVGAGVAVAGFAAIWYFLRGRS